MPSRMCANTHDKILSLISTSITECHKTVGRALRYIGNDYCKYSYNIALTTDHTYVQTVIKQIVHLLDQYGHIAVRIGLDNSYGHEFLLFQYQVCGKATTHDIAILQSYINEYTPRITYELSVDKLITMTRNGIHHIWRELFGCSYTHEYPTQITFYLRHVNLSTNTF